MHLIILQTNIGDGETAARLEPAFALHPGIYQWSVDTEDIDKVLRVEANDSLTEAEMIRLVHAQGFFATPLPE